MELITAPGATHRGPPHVRVARQLPPCARLDYFLSQYTCGYYTIFSAPFFLFLIKRVRKKDQQLSVKVSSGEQVTMQAHPPSLKERLFICINDSSLKLEILISQANGNILLAGGFLSLDGDLKVS